jgi:hypothetical protein
MSSYMGDMLQEVVEGLSRRGHPIEDRGPHWILVEDEDGRRFLIAVSEVRTIDDIVRLSAT